MSGTALGRWQSRAQLRISSRLRRCSRQSREIDIVPDLSRCRTPDAGSLDPANPCLCPQADIETEPFAAPQDSILCSLFRDRGQAAEVEELAEADRSFHRL